MSRFFVFLSTFVICATTAAVVIIWATGSGPEFRAFFNSGLPPLAKELTDKNPTLAADLKIGDEQAMLTVARQYLMGDGVGKDEETGAAWVAYAAKKGSRRATGLMGILHLGGIGVEQDLAAAQKFLFAAGDPQAGELAMRLKIMQDALSKLPEAEQKEQREASLLAARQDIRTSLMNFLQTGELSTKPPAPQPQTPASGEQPAKKE
jgi:TPR repeat protein